MASTSQQTGNCYKALIPKVIHIVSASTIPNQYNDTLDLFRKLCKEPTEKQSQILHELINNKEFINSIIKHFKQLDIEILNVKKSLQKPLNYVFPHFIQILNENLEISDIEQRIDLCLVILINMNETDDFQRNRGQLRSIFSKENNNLFNIISSILNHCKLFRLNLSNKLFRFLQQMLPPINTSKSKSFCQQFNIPILLDRCCDFMIYRMHIDGNGDIDENKDNYNDLYGIQYELPPFIDDVISIVTYFISSKSHKQFVFNHPTLTSCIATLCVRICHELQNIFDLKPLYGVANIMNTEQNNLQNILNKMTISFKNDEYIGHSLVISVAMEYLYYYSLERDIKLIKIPLGEHGKFESFDDCWIEYQYVVALLRLVTNNKILGLYLDTIANKLGYNVNVENEVKNKNKKELTCHQIFSMNKISCFYNQCKKPLDNKNNDKLKKCKGCQSAFYCNKKCQKMDWKYHKQICSNKDNENDDINDMNVCENIDCLNKEKLRRCTGCYNVSYCSVKCQTQHWKQHKKHCKKTTNTKTNQ